MWLSKRTKPAAAGAPSALEALLDAEQVVAHSLQEADRAADRLVQEARAAARAADEAAERELEETLRLLDERAAAERAEDARAIEAEAARRAHLFGDADAAQIEAISERLVLLVAPVPSGP